MSSQTELYPGAMAVRICTSDGKPIDSLNPMPAPTGAGSGASATNPQYNQNVGTGSIVTNQVAVGTSATLVVAARSGRLKVTLSPTASTVYYVGGAGVTTSTGLYVAAGGTVTLDTQAAVYAIGASAVTVSYIEYF